MIGNNLYLNFIQKGSLILFISVLLGFVISQLGFVGAGVLVAIPIAILFLVLLFKNPHHGLYAVMFIGFFANGVSRYSATPIGLSVDVVLLLTLILGLIKSSNNDRKRLNNPFVYGIAVWVGFTIFEIINPQSKSISAWFFAVRGTSLYMIQLIILTVLLMNSEKKLNTFLNIWIGWSALANLWAMKQMYFGLNNAEQQWLNAGAYKTHLLFGKLRAFSFYSDAGQFGAAMAHMLLVCVILGFGPYKFKQKAIYWGLGVFFMWGMAISGTRGALIIPLSGIMVYLLLSRNFKVLIIGVVTVGLLFSALKFTTIGSGNYNIQRMRSGLNPNDPSLLVRLENQKKISTYLTTRPLGGGIGSAGYWGQRFSPGTFLADTPTDSWYVRIWAETGIIGLTIHLAVIFVFLLTGLIVIFKMKYNIKNRQTAIALFAGFVGIALASYGNQVLGQTPTSVVVFMSLGFIWLLYKWDIPLKSSTLP